MQNSNRIRLKIMEIFMIKYSVNSKDLKDFMEKCDTLCKSKLILADKKISNLLKSIAASEDLCIFFKQCLEDFNYKIEFLKAKQPQAEKKDKFILKMPEGKTLIAFVFCLLCEFENKEKDLTDFLIEFYDYNELFCDGYENFCNKVITPFKEAVSELCKGEQQQELNIKPLQANDNIKIDKEKYIKVIKVYQDLCRNILKEGQLTAQERIEYKIVADSFFSACKKMEEEEINILFIALKHMCKNYRFLNNKVKQIEKILTTE